MVVPELHLFQVEREVPLRDAVELHEPLLRIAPEAFQPVDVDLARGKDLPVIQPQVPVAAEHERVVAPELVRVHDTASADLLQGQVEQALGRHIGHHVDLDPAPSLEDAEDGDLPGRAAPAFALAPAPEVRLIQLDFPLEQPGGRVGHDGAPDRVTCLEGRRVAQAHFPADPAGGDLQLKELQDPQPLDGCQLALAHPAAREVSERVATPLAAVALAHGLVDAIAPAPCAEFAPISPHPFPQVFSSFSLTLYPSVERIEWNHGTSLLLVSNH